MNIAPFNKFSRFVRPNILRSQSANTYSTESKKDDEPTIPVNPLKKVFAANTQEEHGELYDRKPFKYRCEAGKVYHWCLCGYSKSQPFCDGTHKNVFMKLKQRPIRFTVTETKDYWLCNCKRTSNRPFCDGTHLTIEPQQYTKRN